MSETPKKTVALNAAKIGGIAAFVPLVLNILPEPYGSIISYVIIACGAIQAAVPAPPAGSYWVLPYRAMSVVALNIGWAINHVAGRVNASQGPVAHDSKPPTPPT